MSWPIVFLYSFCLFLIRTVFFSKLSVNCLLMAFDDIDGNYIR